MSSLKVARLETQVTRFRVAAETLEKSEDELKAEKRKLQREVKLVLAYELNHLKSITWASNADPSYEN